MRGISATGASPVSGMSVAVIGAGLAGLACAAGLRGAGFDVLVLEKSRGLGGRAATRRVDGIGIDHGAQYFTARDPRFREVVRAWGAAGVAAPWTARIGFRDACGLRPADDGTERWVGVPGMSALASHLAEGLAVRREVRVATLDRADGRWCLRDGDGALLAQAHLVLVTAPAPQAAGLLAAAAPLAARAAAVRYAPCWTAMLCFERSPAIPYDGLFCESGPLRWAAFNGGKPGRSGDTWVVHARPEWARGHLDDPPEQVAQALTDALAEIAERPLPPLLWRQAHRWLYSLAETPLAESCLWDPERAVGAAGDWCGEPRFEGAWLSGTALAERVIGAVGA